MRKHFLLTKTLLVALLCLVGQSVWGAAALTKSFAVTGYKAVNLFDFQNLDYDGTALANFDALTSKGVTAQNTIGTAYGSNNWYDDRVNDHGLRLQSGGSRWIQFTVDVKKDDYIIINGGAASEAYEIAMTNGESVAVAGASDYLCFKATQNASNVKLTVHRYNYLLQILIMTKDNTVKTGNYTINYKASGETVKTVSGTDVAVGTEIPILSTFIEGGKKYVTDGGQVAKLTVAEGDNNLDINVTESAKFSCMVNLLAGDKPLSSIGTDVYEGESETLYYSKAYKYDGKWYFVAVNAVSPGYGVSFENVSAATAVNITTFEAWDNVVYFAETENMTLGDGSWAANGNYLNWRSNGMSKRLGANSYIYTDELAAGIYNITLQARNNRSAGDGTESVALFLRDADGDLTDLSTSFPGWARGGYEAANTATITIPNDGKQYSIVINNNTAYNSNLELDYVYVESVPATVPATLGSNGYATFASPYVLDLTTANLPSGVIAYKASVSGTTVTFTALDQTVPANTGVLLKGTGTVNIPVAATGTAVEGNDFLVNEGGATFAGNASYYYFGLVKDSNPLTFRKFDPSATAIPADKAYLKVLKSSVATARGLEFVFDDEVTGVNEVRSQKEDVRSEWFDLQGRKVAQPQKGLYIVNGKKVVLK